MDVRDREVVETYQSACHRLETTLTRQFPNFQWEVEFKHQHRFAPRGIIDPLLLLELGVQTKIIKNWDYAIVVVSNALLARSRVQTIGIPSSALETAVLSTAELDKGERFCDQTIALALHLLGHLWGLEHNQSGPMFPPENPQGLRLEPFSASEQTIIIDRLEEVADKRLEEQSKEWNPISFYWRAFWADPKSILIDIWGYAPWRLPLRMGRLTAATAVSLIILILAAEAWEIGVNINVWGVAVGTVAALLMATTFIYAGQNLGQISRDVGWREQLTRTRIVIYGTVLAGMCAMWGVLFLVSWLTGLMLPNEVLIQWVKVERITAVMLLRHAAFMALLGILAGALGGNLEEEDRIKTELLYDEET